MTQYDNTNSGALFELNEEAPKVVRQGKINIDGYDRRVMAINRKNAQGEDVMVLVQEIGTLKPNPSENEKAPNAKGIIEVNAPSKNMSIAVWKRESANGKKYLSVKVQEYQPKVEDITNQGMYTDNKENGFTEDDILF